MGAVVGRLPDFLVIGAAKSGTTSLRSYLAQHPQVFVPDRGEPSYFAHVGRQPVCSGPGDDEWEFVVDRGQYMALFGDVAAEQVVGEVSPRYLYFPEAADRIAEQVPDARLIAILRHPVDRAYSHFLMNRSRGCEPESSFERAIQRSTEREQAGWGWDWMYAEAGQYAGQIRRYLERFPREQLQIHVYEEWRRQPQEFFAGVFQHIGVDSTFVPDTSERFRPAEGVRSGAIARLTRPGGRARSNLKEWIPDGVRRSLGDAVRRTNKTAPRQLEQSAKERLYESLFAADVAELSALLDRDFDVWSPSGVGERRGRGT